MSFLVLAGSFIFKINSIRAAPFVPGIVLLEICGIVALIFAFGYTIIDFFCTVIITGLINHCTLIAINACYYWICNWHKDCSYNKSTKQKEFYYEKNDNQYHYGNCHAGNDRFSKRKTPAGRTRRKR